MACVAFLGLIKFLISAGGDGTFFQNRAAAMTLHELIHDAFLYSQETKYENSSVWQCLQPLCCHFEYQAGQHSDRGA